MKNILFGLILLGCIGIHSQDKVFRVGVVLGLENPINNSTTYGYYGEYNLGLRLQTGAVFNIAFSEKLGIQPELLLQYRLDDYNEGGYLMIPIMVDIKPFGNGISFQVGPKIGAYIWNPDDFLFTGNAFEYFDLGALAGIQYLANFGLFTNARLGYSYSTALEEGSLTLGLSLGMLF